MAAAESGQPSLARIASRGVATRCIALAHTFEMMAAATSMMMCGICDRFPELRVAFLEAGGGWIAGWLDRMDRHFDDVGMNDTRLTTRPSDDLPPSMLHLLRADRDRLKLLAEHIGPDHILWATDYPHPDGFPGAPNMIKAMGLPPRTLANVLAAGARRFYGLQ